MSDLQSDFPGIPCINLVRDIPSISNRNGAFPGAFPGILFGRGYVIPKTRFPGAWVDMLCSFSGSMSWHVVQQSDTCTDQSLSNQEMHIRHVSYMLLWFVSNPQIFEFKNVGIHLSVWKSCAKFAKSRDASLQCDVLLQPTAWIARSQGYRLNQNKRFVQRYYANCRKDHLCDAMHFHWHVRLAVPPWSLFGQKFPRSRGFSLADLVFWETCGSIWLNFVLFFYWSIVIYFDLFRVTIRLHGRNALVYQRQTKGGNSGEGKTYHKPLARSSFGPPMIPVTPCHFSLEETGTHQTNPTFWALQNWFWRAHPIVRFPP